MSDSETKPEEGGEFALGVAIVHWGIGIIAFLFSFSSWKFVAIGSSCWMLAGLILIATAIDNDL